MLPTAFLQMSSSYRLGIWRLKLDQFEKSRVFHAVRIKKSGKFFSGSFFSGRLKPRTLVFSLHWPFLKCLGPSWKSRQFSQGSGSVSFWSGSDPTFHFDADPDAGDPTQVLQMENVPVCFVFLVSVIGCHKLNIVDTLYWNFQASHLVEIDTNPDLHPGPADLIRQNDTNPTESGSTLLFKRLSP